MKILPDKPLSGEQESTPGCTQVVIHWVMPQITSACLVSYRIVSYVIFVAVVNSPLLPTIDAILHTFPCSIIGMGQSPSTLPGMACSTAPKNSSLTGACACTCSCISSLRCKVQITFCYCAVEQTSGTVISPQIKHITNESFDERQTQLYPLRRNRRGPSARIQTNHGIRPHALLHKPMKPSCTTYSTISARSSTR